MKNIAIIIMLFLVAATNLNAQDQKKQNVVFEIERSELLKMTSILDLLKKYYPEQDYSSYIFRSYELSFSAGSLEVIELVVGSDFNSKVMAVISGSKPGEKLYFTKIKALEPVGRKLNFLPSVILKIK